MSRYLLLFLSLGLLVACPSSNDDDSGSDDDDTANDDDAAELTPEEGSWELTLTQLNTDSCNGAPGAGPGDSLGTTTVAVTDGGRDFVMIDSDDQTFRCTFTAGDAFTCDADPLNIEVQIFPNATVTRAGTRAGTLDSATTATLSSNTNTDTCEGDDCDEVELAGGYSFPCVFDFTATAEK